ncbi:MobA/MobL family protein [Tardiphaga sp. 804_B3_N1_9]|uniref:MobA/MobL family protein n=1 Tax=Tardiphaga sp. 804_B3_N1_9 TaxID=3240786 RepID=UPI003F256214
MAIYSLHHSPVGKSTQAQPYTAAAHIGYITRKNAMSQMRFERIPAASPRQMAAYLRQCEDTDRKNARVIDKLMLALPRELDSAQRAELVRGYAEDITEGRAPWLAAFHEKGKDKANPHCHLVLRDRDFETNRRVIGTSEKGSTERLRQKWEEHANRALERAGHRERIDRRTLKAQGLEREPTIHEGPQAQAMDKRGARPTSRRRSLRNRPGSRDSHRTVDYRAIDRGVSRPQANRAIRQGRPESEKDLWEAVDRDNVNREQQDLRDIHRPPDSGKVVPFPRNAQKTAASPRLNLPAKKAVPNTARRAKNDEIERPPLEKPVDRSQRDRVKNETAEPMAKEKRPSFSQRLREERAESRPLPLDRQSEQNDPPKEKRSFSQWLRSPEAKNTKAPPAKDKSRDWDQERER